MNYSTAFFSAVVLAETVIIQRTGNAQPIPPRQPSLTVICEKTKPGKAVIKSAKQTPGEKALQEQFQKWGKENSQPPIKLLAPVSGIPRNTALQVTVVNSVSGRLALSSYDDQQQPVTSLVLCAISSQASINATTQSDQKYRGPQYVTYPTEKHGDDKFSVLYDPSFSPDGRYVLFKYGMPWSDAGGFYLYVLDTQTNVVKRIPPILNYKMVSWSPDSNYIAFVEGGTADGDTNLLNHYVGPLMLDVCEWRSGKLQLITTNDTIRGPFSWIAPHSLIYGVLPSSQQELAKHRELTKEQDKGKNVASKPENKKPNTSTRKPNATPNYSQSVNTQPNVYEYSPDIRKSNLLFRDGYHPVASPDGQWIAFFGSENPRNRYPLLARWQDYPTTTSLCIAHRDGTNRKALDRVHGFYPPLYWSSDNQHLLTVSEIRPSPNVKIQVKAWEIKTGKWHQVTLLQANDYKLMDMPTIDGHFHFLGFSQDGTTFYVFLTEFVKHDAMNNSSIGIAHLQEVNLNTGDTKTVVNILGDSGADWHEITTPPKAGLAMQMAIP